jgi:hypothetical protein
MTSRQRFAIGGCLLVAAGASGETIAESSSAFADLKRSVVFIRHELGDGLREYWRLAVDNSSTL